MDIQSGAKTAGGLVHLVLGRDDIERLTNVLESAKINAAVDDPLFHELSKKHLDWLIDLPYVIQINEQVFSYKGLSEIARNMSLDDFNQSLKRELIESSSDKLAKDQAGSVEAKLFSKFSPINYDGNALCHPFFESDRLTEILGGWNAKKLWTNHIYNKKTNIYQRLNGQLFTIDMGNVYPQTDQEDSNQVMVAKLLTNGQIFLANGDLEFEKTPQLAPNRYHLNPDDMSDAEVEDFLKTAKVIDKENTKRGITKPFKVTLKKGEKILYAVFKYLDTYPRAQYRKWNKDKAYADRYIYELAAYKFDRILKLGLVPVTVKRKIEGQQGVVQLWIENLTSKLDMEENGVKYNGFCDRAAQHHMMYAFDYLVRNTDRNQSNTLYGEGDGQIWFIDHSRAFGTSLNRSQELKKKTIDISESFKAALQALPYQELLTLSPWLHQKQIKALWKRRKKLLSGRF